MDVTYNYWCTHGCYGNDNIPVTKDHSKADDPELCPKCNEPMKRIGRVCNSFLGSFDSRSPQEKKEILKKRARDHERTNKRAKEYKEHVERTGKQTKY